MSDTTPKGPERGSAARAGKGKKSALSSMTDDELLQFRAALEVEMRKRKLAFSVGEVGERLVIEYFGRTKGLPKLQSAPRGTKNVDALSREGDRYSIKTVWRGGKTGQIYPDRDDAEKQLFERLLVVLLTDQFQLEAIYSFTWDQFCKCRSWDKRMSAWYLSASQKNYCAATTIFPQPEVPATGVQQVEARHPAPER